VIDADTPAWRGLLAREIDFYDRKGRRLRLQFADGRFGRGFAHCVRNAPDTVAIACSHDFG
jgi:hypothetical protein